jgi:hypothetical protein
VSVDTVLWKAQCHHMTFDRDQMKENAAALAAKGVFVGTSNWKYEGRLGQMYTSACYEFLGKVTQKLYVWATHIIISPNEKCFTAS